jgi:formylglycine-generating enzyme required for sulfatase activity/serine/threonine protein kinase
MEARPVIHPSEDALRAFALGKLDDSTASVLMSHLDSCPDCCKVVAALSGDDFLDRLRQAHGRSSTPAPAKSLADAARAPKPPASQAPIPNLPPALAANEQYEILRELGRGGMGVVYLAKNKLMDRLEVLKVINKALLDRPGAVERFLREIRSAAKLSHANVVAAYSAVQQGELLAFAMEYIEGQDLASLVKSRGPVPVIHACYYVQQAALGLQHAHEKQMVHRDIKPQNLILAREGKKHIVKVLDFGLAKVMREKTEDTGLTGEGAMLGTPDYIAPEQSLDAAKADIRADMYSLGCTLYFLLAGRPPFSASSLGAILMAHQTEEAKPLNLVRPEVPEELAALVRKMMAKSPAKRYQTPLEVVQALGLFVKQATGAASASRAFPSPELSVGAAEPKPAVKKVARVDPPPVPAEPATKKQSETANVWESLTESSSAPAEPRRRERFSDVTIGSLLARSISFLGPRENRTVHKHRAATVWHQASRNKWLVGGGLGAGVLLLVLLGMWASGVFTAKVKTQDGTIVLENLPADAEVIVDGEKVTVGWQNGGKQAEIRVKAGTHKVEIKKDGISVDGKELTLRDGEREIFTVRLLPEKREAKAKAPPPENLPPKPEMGDEPKTELSEYVNSLGMNFRLIPAGTFIMGSSPSEIERCINLKLSYPPPEQFEAEGPAHEVEITKPFYIGIHEVTVGQFRQFAKAMDYKTQAEKEGGAFRNLPYREGLEIDGATNWRNPGFEQTDDHPVVCVSWDDAVAFCTWLSRKEGRKYRLPSEAEWEYCCRAKTTTRFCCGDDESRLKEFANLQDASLNQRWPRIPWRGFTAPVGQFQKNAFGLHDMHGNVWEWCADWYDKDYYKNSPKQDPQGPLRPSVGNFRVIRGGSWQALPTHSRSAFRTVHPGSGSVWFLGFRVVLLPEKGVANGFVPLFNGKDLTGWKTHPKQPGDWHVEDGILMSRGTPSHLFSERGDYENFHLRLEARINKGGNSGLYFRSEFGVSIFYGIPMPSGYEAEIVDGNTTGSLLDWFSSRASGVENLLKDPNDWFTQEVIADNDHIVILVNGQTAVDYRLPAGYRKRGHFALQHFSPQTVAKFRKIEIKELK